MWGDQLMQVCPNTGLVLALKVPGPRKPQVSGRLGRLPFHLVESLGCGFWFLHLGCGFCSEYSLTGFPGISPLPCLCPQEFSNISPHFRPV